MAPALGHDMILSKAQKYERIARVLERIQGMIESEGGEPAEARRGLEDVLGRIGVDLEVALVLDAATLGDTLAAGGAGKLWSVAEVLYLQGRMELAENRPEEAVLRLRKARGLFERLDETSELPEGAASPHRRRREIDDLLG